MARDLFDAPEEQDEPPEPGADRRCTPEKLLAFIQETKAASGRCPTLKDCKERFGGILGVLADGWELQRRGLI